MRYILTLVLALVFINSVRAQSQLEQEIIKDFSIIDSISTEALKYANDCSKSELFEDKMKEAFVYYNERRAYHLNSVRTHELTELERGYLTFYVKAETELHDFKRKVSVYSILCNEIGTNLAIQNEEEIKKIVSVYDYYSELSDQYYEISNHIRNSEYELEYNMNEVTCEQLEAIKPHCDNLDLTIESYLARVDSANIQFYALPEKHQNLILKNNDKRMVTSDSEDEIERNEMEYLNGLINASLVDYLLFEDFKGFRMDLSYEDHYISEFIAPRTSNLREIVESMLKKKNCQ